MGNQGVGKTFSITSCKSWMHLQKRRKGSSIGKIGKYLEKIMGHTKSLLFLRVYGFLVLGGEGWGYFFPPGWIIGDMGVFSKIGVHKLDHLNDFINNPGLSRSKKIKMHQLSWITNIQVKSKTNSHVWASKLGLYPPKCFPPFKQQHKTALVFQVVICTVKLNYPLINVDSVTHLTKQHQDHQLGNKICISLCPLSSKSALTHEVPLASVAGGSHQLSQASGNRNVQKSTASEGTLPLGNGYTQQKSMSIQPRRDTRKGSDQKHSQQRVKLCDFLWGT